MATYTWIGVGKYAASNSWDDSNGYWNMIEALTAKQIEKEWHTYTFAYRIDVATYNQGECRKTKHRLAALLLQKDKKE